MPAHPLTASAVIAPLQTLAAQRGTLAVITAIDGPSYRPLGAMMAVLEDGTRIGTLSSGCVEGDIALHAAEALSTGSAKTLRYGKGSPFTDITLPCGGGLEITLIPAPDQSLLESVTKAHAARTPTALKLTGQTMTQTEPHETGWQGDAFTVTLLPELLFYVFGKGPEAATFATLTHASGFPTVLLSPDDETLTAAPCETQHLTGPRFPVSPDARAAVVLFFHDHDWEPPILLEALRSPAFYVGAQGSQRAAALRRFELETLGSTPEELLRLRGPIGLVPSARDARKLAVSVLAEVLSLAN